MTSHENIPIDLLVINSKFEIEECSAEAQIKADIVQFETCYEFLGYSGPCKDCPMSNNNRTKELVDIGHTLKDRYILETIKPLPSNNGALITFVDTTRKVELIEKIRDQQNTIEYQKNLQADLINLMKIMQQDGKETNAVKHFLTSISKWMNSNSATLFVQGMRKGSIWISENINLSDKTKEELIQEYLKLPLRSQKVNKFNLAKLSKPKYVWEHYFFGGDEMDHEGLLLLDVAMDEEKKQVLSLFCDSMNTYLHNKVLTKRLEVMAHNDSLTGLYNRFFLLEALEEERNKFEKYEIPFIVIIGDANGLKMVNDKHGHEAGDQLLKKIAFCLRTVSRDTDIIARQGGDEFCVLMPNTKQEGGEAMVKRIKEFCKTQKLEVSGYPPIPVSVSLGVSGSDDGHTDYIMQLADNNMYKDKEDFYSHSNAKR